MDFTRGQKSEGIQRARRTRMGNAQNQLIEAELKYLNENPEEYTEVPILPGNEAADTYKKIRGSIMRISRVLGVPVTVRQSDKGLMFWKATEEEIKSRPRGPGRRPAPATNGKERPRRMKKT